MGRKSRRKAKLRAAARMAQRAPVQPVYQKPVSSATPPARPAAEPRPLATSVQSSASPIQANRYQYVLPELRQIAIIAGALFVILFILALVLH